jgi:hypothetical protein
MAYLLAHTIRIEEDLVDHLFNSSEKRLARVLLLLAHFGKEGKPEAVIAKINQETLAEMTTRSRISFFMNKFRKPGFIDYNGALHVHSSLLNVALRGLVPSFPLAEDRLFSMLEQLGSDYPTPLNGEGQTIQSSSAPHSASIFAALLRMAGDRFINDHCRTGNSDRQEGRERSPFSLEQCCSDYLHSKRQTRPIGMWNVRPKGFVCRYLIFQ